MSEEVNCAVAGSLGTSKRSTKGQSFAGQDASPLIAKALVLTKHIANLTCAGTNVTSWNIGVRTNVASKLGHE